MNNGGGDYPLPVFPDPNRPFPFDGTSTITARSVAETYDTDRDACNPAPLFSDNTSFPTPTASMAPSYSRANMPFSTTLAPNIYSSVPGTIQPSTSGHSPELTGTTSYLAHDMISKLSRARLSRGEPKQGARRPLHHISPLCRIVFVLSRQHSLVIIWGSNWTSQDT